MTRVCSGTPSWRTTAFYTKVATRTVRTVTSPLDRLGMLAAAENAPESARPG
jgi:hypothetical protein